MTTHNLDALFHPSSVAVVGSSNRAGRLGTLVLRNLIEGGFPGEVLAVYPKYAELHGGPVVARVAGRGLGRALREKLVRYLRTRGLGVLAGPSSSS